MDRLRRWRTSCKKPLQRLLPTRGQHVPRHDLAPLPPHLEEPPSSNLYNDLQDGEIRLFELDINTAGNVVGRLKIVETSSSPLFYALSYVCGSDASSEDITINNRAVPVRPNLFAALKELRSYFEGERIAKVAIWIDAICIDQGNAEEKSKQIRRMHSVFAGAAEVLVWLGAVDDDVRMVLRVFAWISAYLELRPDMEALRQHENEPEYHLPVTEPTMKALSSLFRLQHCLEIHHRVSYKNLCAMVYFLIALGQIWGDIRLYDGLDDLDDAMGTAMNSPPILNAGLFPPEHVFWAAVYTLANLEWFERTWTYQEILLSQEASILAQGVRVPMVTFRNSMDVLIGVLQSPSIFDETSQSSRTRHMPRLDERMESNSKWVQLGAISGSTAENIHVPLPVIRSLIKTKRRVSTMAKDQVYGLTALWQRKVQDEIAIDYTIATAEVFANAVKIGMKMEEDGATIADLWAAFDGFDCTPQALETARLPSWCPDFHHSADPPFNARYKLLSPDVSKRTRPSACYEYTTGFETIAIRILKLDRIAKTMASVYPRRADEFLPWLQELLRLVWSVNQTNRSLGHDMQTFLYQDRYNRGRDSAVSFDTFSKCLAHLAPALSSQSTNVLQDDVESTLDILMHQSGRFLFLTESGRIGWSARQPCLKGHIVLVPGSDPLGTLHMLNADCTQYVGCASVDGLMHDTLLESLDDMETKWETVVLR
jgi:hypothetical protein